MIDPAVLARLTELEKAATPAPWPEEYVQGAVRHISKNCDTYQFCREDIGFDWDRYKDGPLITEARNALPALLITAREHATLAQEVREALEHCTCYRHGSRNTDCPFRKLAALVGKETP
jgi:hypothetical protein